MKNNTIASEMQKKIATQSEKIAKIDNDIATEKALIASLSERIASYTDYENVEAFNALRSEKAEAEGKLELLNRKRKAEETISPEEVRTDYNQFFTEKKAILDKFDKDAAPLIEKLEALFNETHSNIEELNRIFGTWSRTFRITDPTYSASTLPWQEGLHARVGQFLSREKVVDQL